jgi:hypothetical protein
MDVTPFADYTFSFWIRGTQEIFSYGIQIPFLGDCTTMPPPPDDPTRPTLCPDNDGDEQLDLGPTPPLYHKEHVAVWGPLAPSSSTDWNFVSQTFNSGPYSTLYVWYWQTFLPGNYADLDDISVTPQGGSCGNGTCDPNEDCNSCPQDCGPCGCSCDGTDINGNPVHSNVCGSTVCGLDGQVYSCTTSGYQGTGTPCSANSCAVYASQSGIQVCSESATECILEAVNNGGRSCDDVCNAGGGTCLRVHGNNSSDPCTVLGVIPGACSVVTGDYDDLCVCTH